MKKGRTGIYIDQYIGGNLNLGIIIREEEKKWHECAKLSRDLACIIKVSSHHHENGQSDIHPRQSSKSF